MPLRWNEARDRWEGDVTTQDPALVFNAYTDLPSPASVTSGTVAVVLGGPRQGLHVAHGPKDAPGTYWRADK